MTITMRCDNLDGTEMIVTEDTIIRVPTVPHIQFLDEGAIQLEWTADRTRFGIRIEPELSESSWYISASDYVGDPRNNSGTLPLGLAQAVAGWLNSA